MRETKTKTSLREILNFLESEYSQKELERIFNDFIFLIDRAHKALDGAEYD